MVAGPSPAARSRRTQSGAGRRPRGSSSWRWSIGGVSWLKRGRWTAGLPGPDCV